MVRPPPISLTIRAAEAKYNARRILRQLDEKDQLQRRVKWQANKAIIAIQEMISIARMLPGGDNAGWRREIEQAQSLLKKVARIGV